MKGADRPRTLPLLGRLVRHQPGLWSLHFLLVTCAAYVLPFLPGLLVRDVLDRLARSAGAGLNVATALALFAGLGAAQLVVQVCGQLNGTAQMQYASVLMRRNMLQRVLERPGARALPASPGEALVRFGSDTDAVALALEFSVDPFGQALAYVLALWILARVDRSLTVAVVLPALAVLFAVHLAAPKIREARRARQDAQGAVTGWIGDAFAAVASIKAAGAEERVAGRLEALNEARRRATLRDALIDQVLGSVSANTAALATGVLLMLAASQARTGRFTAGDFALFTSYLTWFGTVVTYAGHTFTAFRQSEASAARMAEVLQGAPASDLAAPRPVHLRGPLPTLPRYAKAREDRLERLEARGLTFVHPGSGRGIAGVNLSVERGEIVAVTGRVGSGKTTLLRALLGLLPLDAGEVWWNGRRIEAPGGFLVPPRCAYTPQAPRLFSLPLRDNVLLGLPADGADLDAAAHAAALDRDLAGLPAGWDAAVGPHGLRLSGGQRQRAALARMVVRDAELLVVDDLGSALDAETERVVWQRLTAPAERSCLVVTHRPHALRRADRVLLMAEGRVEAAGTLRELLDASAEMRGLWSGGSATQPSEA